MNVSLISVVLPVHDQADHVAEIIHQYEDTLAGLPAPHELVIVPNACRDRTPEICDELAREFPAIRVVRTEEKGWGRAVNLGLRAARGDLLCYTNAARTTAKDLALLVVYATMNPGTVVTANRKIRESMVRRMGSLLYNLECRALFDLSYWDINGTPKVFPRAFERLLSLSRNDDLIDAEFNAVCRREGYPIISVPIFSSRRHGGKSTTNLRSAARMYWGAYALWREMKDRDEP